MRRRTVDERLYEAQLAADAALAAERDRRYTEVAAEREKALKIKELADAEALRLAREATADREEAHNGLLGQLRDERAEYPSREEIASIVAKLEAQIVPLANYVTSQTATTTATQRREDTVRPWMLWLAATGVAAVQVVLRLAT